MLKDSTYKEKFAMLKEWLPSLIETVKKDLKNDHLRQDTPFCKKYFAGKNFNKLTTEDLVQAYAQAMEESEKAEELAEFISNRWVLKNSELYDFFEQQLSRINPNFTEIKEIDAASAQALVNDAVKTYGAPRTYLFSVLNSVVFPEKVFHELGQRAKDEAIKEEGEMRRSAENTSLENVKQHYEQHIARLTDKYEKKLAGLQKKYTIDIDSLKKQIAHLQRKINTP